MSLIRHKFIAVLENHFEDNLKLIKLIFSWILLQMHRKRRNVQIIHIFVSLSIYNENKLNYFRKLLKLRVNNTFHGK